MAKRLYTEVIAGSDLGIFDDPPLFNKAADIAILADVVEKQALSSTIRTLIANCGSLLLADYDLLLADLFDDLSERIDYYDYGTDVENTTVMTGAWFSPIAITAFGSEDPTFPATNTIDGDLSSQWRHEVVETHTMTWELRAYPKKIEKMRFRYGNGENVREQLENITIRSSKNLNKIDDPGNIIATGVNPVWPIGQGNTWVEVEWPTKKNRGRFIKIEFETAHGNNHARIREVEFWVTTRNPDESL